MFRTAVRRKSCRSIPVRPAALQALAHVFRNVYLTGSFEPILKMRKEERQHSPQAALEHADTVNPERHHTLEVSRHVDHPALVILRHPRVESDAPRVEVDLTALEGENFALHSLPERIGDRCGDLKILGELPPNPSNCSRSKKPASGAVSFGLCTTGKA